MLTVDVADDDNLAGCDFNVNLASAGIDDDDNNTLTVNGAPTAVGRAITVNAGGTLSITRELTDPLANRAKHVLGGTTSDYLAAFELNAVNEGMDIEDLVLQVSGAGASNFADSVSEVILYDADGAELDREFVSTTPVTFDNVNLNIDEGSTMVYVKVVADLIGKSQNGETIADVAFRLAAANVKGAGSSDDIVATYDDTGATLSGYAFDVIPVHMSDIALVSSYSSYTVPATANNGTEQNLAIVKVTANTWDNTDLDDNSALKLVLSGLAIYNTNTNVVSGSSLTLKRIDISNGTEMVGIVSSNTVTFNLAASGATIDKEITK
ncbi:MAG: hypothetical protein Q8O99_06605 [bacterium]|nr:hypothetical protein [bacterium]